MEYAPNGIRVNTVNPGPIETPMMRELESGFNPADPAAGATFLKSTTLLNRYGTAPEVAELMCWLASDAGAYATGGIFMLDGGMHLA
jgi:NAD(P)-dependent dehydrogenase (short-subunit alcohol dehydrogenase family)